MPLILGTNSIKDTGYDVANSCRFNSGSDDHLDKTFGQAGNRRTFTVSFWIKTTTKETYNAIFDAGADGSNSDDLYFHTGRLNFSGYYGSTQFALRTTAKFRDPSAWSHHVIAFDTTQGTASNRIKFFTNGLQETVFDDETYPSQNFQTSYMNTARLHNIGTLVNNDDFPLDGYLAEFVFIDGSALAPDQFGEFDSDSGIWKPIDVSGLTFGTNGFYLDFEDSSALGDDVSGNGNDFAMRNLTAIDQSTDTCTNNFATYNSIFGQGRQDLLTYAEGNLSVTSSHTTGSDTTSTSTFAFDSGKWYAEFKLTSSADGVYVGVATSNLNFTNSGIDTSGNSNCWITRGDDGTVRNNGSTAYFGTSFSNNDIIQIAIDMDNSKIWWGLNGTYGNSGNPSTGSNPAYSNLSGELMIIVGDNYSDRTPTILANFGSPPYSISSGNSDGNGYGNMEYEIPSGYYILNSKNLAEYG